MWGGVGEKNKNVACRYAVAQDIVCEFKSHFTV